MPLEGPVGAAETFPAVAGASGRVGAARASGARSAASATDAAFDEFWALYPRKVAKGNARKAFAAAVAAGADPAAIIGGLRVNLQQMTDRIASGDGRYIKHPATWLNAGCWEDAPEEQGGGKLTTLHRQTMERLRMMDGG